MPASAKRNLTIRLNDETREKLELIAEKEFRPMANQISAFTIQSIERYMKDHDLVFVKDSDTGILKIGKHNDYLRSNPGLQPGDVVTVSEPPF